ncbi:MAG: hypothetical protein INQ03_04490 [Candidatus Heimdallarchaeota archaeon]|nr:hypothetical protein [Candidatus Heimdallarchaeota archaeon]
MWKKIWKTIAMELADAFDDVSFDIESSTLFWEGLEYKFINAQICNQPPCIKLIDHVTIEEKNGFQDKFYTFSDPITTEHPILMEENFGFYSFKDKSSIYKIRELLDVLAAQQKNKNVLRYFGALMHLFDSQIITIENDSDTILAISLVTKLKIEDEEFVIIEAIHDFSEFSNYQSKLLERILAQNSQIYASSYNKYNLFSTYFKSSLTYFRYASSND